MSNFDAVNFDTINEVYRTTNYDLFKVIDGNRIINELHVKRLMDSMHERLLLTPIIVNEFMEIIDGQHRYTALKNLTFPVCFIVCPGYGLEEVHRLNEKSHNWSLDDFLSGYCVFARKDDRYKDYLLLNDFVNENNITIAMAINLTDGDTAVFKSGAYRAKNLESAQFFLNQLEDFAMYFSDFYRTSAFIRAFQKISNSSKYSHENMLRKLEYLSGSLVRRSTAPQYIEILCDIYNSRLTEKKRIYFKGEKEIA